MIFNVVSSLLIEMTVMYIVNRVHDYIIMYNNQYEVEEMISWVLNDIMNQSMLDYYWRPGSTG